MKTRYACRVLGYIGSGCEIESVSYDFCETCEPKAVQWVKDNEDFDEVVMAHPDERCDAAIDDGYKCDKCGKTFTGWKVQS